MKFVIYISFLFDLSPSCSSFLFDALRINCFFPFLILSFSFLFSFFFSDSLISIVFRINCPSFSQYLTKVRVSSSVFVVLKITSFLLFSSSSSLRHDWCSSSLHNPIQIFRIHYSDFWDLLRSLKIFAKSSDI